MTNYSNTLLYKALKDKYVAQISEAEATMEIYFEKAVGIGEHPQHVEEMDKLMCKIADAEDKLDLRHAYFGDTGEDDKSDDPSG